MTSPNPCRNVPLNAAPIQARKQAARPGQEKNDKLTVHAHLSGRSRTFEEKKERKLPVRYLLFTSWRPTPSAPAHIPRFSFLLWRKPSLGKAEGRCGMPLLGTQSSDGSGPSSVSKSLQDERRSLEEREGRTPGKESPSPFPGLTAFPLFKTMPQMKIFRFVRKKAFAFMTIPSYLFEFTRHEPEVVSVPIF